jgi:hypothetical protein
VKASAAGEDVSEAAVGEAPADVAAAATGGTVVDVLGAQVVVVVVLDGAVVVVVVVGGTVVVVVLVEVVVVEVVVLVELVLEVLVLVELAVLVEVDVDGLEVDVLVVVLAGHTVEVVVVGGTVEVVVLVDVLVVVGSTTNPVGAVGPEPIVVAAARLPADRVAERTTAPKRTFINRTDQPGIRQSFPPPSPHRSGWWRSSAQRFAIATHDGRWARWPGRYETVNVSRPWPGGCRQVGGPIVPIEVAGVLRAPPGAARWLRARPASRRHVRLTRISSRCHAELTVF